MPAAAQSRPPPHVASAPLHPSSHSPRWGVRTSTVVIHHTTHAISHPAPRPPANPRHRLATPRGSQIPIGRVPAAPFCPHFPRFPPLEVFVRRPPVRVARHVSGRHPKTFTKLRPPGEFSNNDRFTPGSGHYPARTGRSESCRNRTSKHPGSSRRSTPLNFCPTHNTGANGV